MRLALKLLATVIKGTHVMQEIEFELNGEYVELNQLLKLVGVCDSGGAGKALVAAGEVSVDGHVELRKTCKVRAGSVVTLGDVVISVNAAV
jgi:ribosome-associated protein